MSKWLDATQRLKLRKMVSMRSEETRCNVDSSLVSSNKETLKLFSVVQIEVTIIYSE